MTRIVSGIILGFSVVLGALILAGRYEVVATGGSPGYVIVMDRWTGTPKTFCEETRCGPISREPAGTDAAAPDMGAEASPEGAAN